MIRWLFAGLLATVCVNNVPAADVPATESRTILTESGVKGGLVVHVGCGDGRLTAALRANEAYRVHGLDTKTENVAAARRHIQSLGLYGPVSVESWEGPSLPYADNLVNLVVAEKLDRCSMEEVLRVLAPLGGRRTSGRQMVGVRPSSHGRERWATGLTTGRDRATIR